MESQTLINIASGATLAAIGWFCRVVWDSVNRLKEDLHKMEVNLAVGYVRKEDFSEHMRVINDKLDRIYDKIDGKVDK